MYGQFISTKNYQNLGIIGQVNISHQLSLKIDVIILAGKSL